MRVAVVGGGLYGIHCANKIASKGHDVTIFEKENELMMAASKVNQWRLHKGFHYPRSKSTSRMCKDTQRVFREVYNDAIVDGEDNYYCIASEDTKTSPKEFKSHCDQINLNYVESSLDLVKEDMIDLCLKVDEDRVDPSKLKKICLNRLEKNEVDLKLNHRIDSLGELDQYDYIIVATYANSNWLFEEDSDLRRDYKFELVEKPVVKLPEKFEGKSLVVMDGPFMCFDPYKQGNKFLLGNVVHCVHETQVGEIPDFDPKYDELLNNGLIKDPKITNIDKFKSHGSKFIPGLEEAEHVGSMYTYRTTLPNREDTDERPTIIDQQDHVFRVFSGKLSGCIYAGEQIVDKIEKKEQRATLNQVQ